MARKRRLSARRRTLYAAVAANVAIAATKLVVAAVIGSSAMFSEGLHSIVDTGDGLLILLGLNLSHRPPSRKHPYGHGLQVYFWSMVVAMCIFGIGGGLSIYEGILHLLDGRAPSSPGWGLAVLALAAIFEGISWLISVRAFRRHRGDRGVWEAIEASKDPTTFVVVLEDSAALVGIAIAAVGLALACWLHMPVFDALASILIGGLLAAVGVVLGRETWSLLLGESAAGELVDSIRSIARAQPKIADVRPPRTLHLGPDVVHVDLDVHVDPDSSGPEVEEAARQIEAAVHAAHPEVDRVCLRFPHWR